MNSQKEQNIQKILCPIDFSELSLTGLRYAAETAKANAAKLVVMNVTYDLFDCNKSDTYYTDTLSTFVEELRQLTKVAEEFTELDITTYHCLGDAAPQIVNYAKNERFDLVVLGASGRTRFSKWLLGSVAESVIEKSPINVLVVKKDRPENDRVKHDRIEQNRKDSTSSDKTDSQPVLVPFDFTEASVAALKYAVDWADSPDQVVAVYVCPPVSSFDFQQENRVAMECLIQNNNSQRFFESFCPAEFSSVQFKTLFDQNIARTISDKADELQAQLIVLPGNQKSFLTRLFLGSNAVQIVRKSSCPSLVLKSAEATEEDIPSKMKLPSKSVF